MTDAEYFAALEETSRTDPGMLALFDELAQRHDAEVRELFRALTPKAQERFLAELTELKRMDARARAWRAYWDALTDQERRDAVERSNFRWLAHVRPCACALCHE